MDTPFESAQPITDKRASVAQVVAGAMGLIELGLMIDAELARIQRECGVINQYHRGSN